MFRFRLRGDEPLAAFGVTIPRRPGHTEAMLVEGPWRPIVNG
jgi:mannose-6-phosphate isomerase-like protein (cupin superfamily)